MKSFDLIIIGSGPGGYNAAHYAAKHGLQVAIVESLKAGGTCLNIGCIPTKSLAHDAELVNEQHLTDDEKAEAFVKAMERKEGVERQLVEGVETLLSQPGITLFHGEAAFKDAHTISVGGEDLEGKNIIIATGSLPKMPPIPGIDSPAVISSTELLSLSQRPKSLCIVGAGVIGMEFAYILHSFGCKVTVVEFLKESLSTMDGDIAKRLRKLLEKQGIEFYFQSGVKRIDGNKVTFERKGKEQTVEAEKILVATGRKANIDGLQLDNTGVTADRRGIIVDDNMRTNVDHIYAIGDCNARQMLAHAASFQGFRAVNTILGKSDNIHLDIMPAAVFTSPEAAGVGPTEEQCKEKNTEYKTYKGFYRANGRALSMDATEGMLKLITTPDGQLLGCHAYGAHAADMVQEVAALMNMGATVQQLADMVHIHPTLSEILQEAARTAL
mgnify:FL=1